MEGLAVAKLISIETYMQEYGIHLLCLQEVRKPLSEHSITDKGYLLICSGRKESLEYAGVVFLVPSELPERNSECRFSFVS